MLSNLAKRVIRFEAEAHKLLGAYEGSASRIVDARKSLDRVSALSVKQDDMLAQAVRCVEVQVFRAAHVLAFAAFVDYLHEIAARDNFVTLNAARPKWDIKSVEELRENHADYNFIEALEASNLIGKTERKVFHGLLARRNECAHPSDVYPDMNQSLGYLSEIIGRAETLKKRYP